MAITQVTTPKPQIMIAGVAQTEKVTGQHTNRVVNQAVQEFSGPISLSFNAANNPTIYYTLNGKNPTLGSATLAVGDTVTVRSNGNGFGSDNTIIKARSYLNGVPSEIAKIEIKIV